MVQGTLYGLAACFLWGLIFVIPTFMHGFDSLEIALGRHSIYGIVSILFLSISYNKFKKYPLKHWLRAVVFALITNIFYYSCVVKGVSCASPALTALILGMSPIIISFFGNWLEQECNYRDLVGPAVLIFLGLLLVNLPSLQEAHIGNDYWFGILTSFGALFAWSWFVVMNARFLKRNPEVVSGEWSTMIGVATFCWVAILGTLYETWHGPEHWKLFTTPSEALNHYIIGCLILGIVCSWVGVFLWNNASSRLPVSFAGELTIFETLFGLLFFYLIEWRIPPYTEMIGAALMVSAVFYSLRLNTSRKEIVIE